MSLLNKALKRIDEANHVNHSSSETLYPKLKRSSVFFAIKEKRFFLIVLMILGFLAVVALMVFGLSRFNTTKTSRAQLPLNQNAVQTVKTLPVPAQTIIHVEHIKKNVPPYQQSSQAAIVSKPSTVAKPSAEDIYRLFQSATENLKQDNVMIAGIQFEKVLRLSPGMKKAREALLVLKLQTGDFSQVIKLANDGLLLSPNYVPFVMLKARAMVQLNQVNGAINLLEQVAPSLPDHLSYYNLLASLYDNVGDFNKAVVMYQELLNLDPNNGANWVGLGVALDSLGRHDEAIDVYKRALRVNGLSPTLQDFIEKQISAG